MLKVVRERPSARLTRLTAILWSAVFLASSTIAKAQEKVDLEVVRRIDDAAFNHSQVMDIVSYLTDITGPRLTGSPNLKRAQEYARDRLREWGLANAHLESWGPFGRGWSLEGFTANVTSPGFSTLIAYPKAWSPSTPRTIRGEAVFLNVKTASDLDKYRGKLKGKIVLFSPARHVDPLFEPPAHRQTDEELLGLSNEPPRGPRPFQPTAEQRATEGFNNRKWQFVQSEGGAVVLQPSYRDAGTVYVTAATVPYPSDQAFEKHADPWDLSKPVVTPQVVVAAEQYNRLVRLAERGIPVELEVGIAARFHDDEPMSYNVIAEIPGTDLKNEVVMVGGSLDSWHAGTGATDNAVGAATALEIIRILQSLQLKPRRTIRIGLWSAEEQGSLGSRAYVSAHFGRAISPAERSSGPAQFELKPEYKTFDAYFNFDYGTGRIRGIYLQGNEAVRPIFRALLEPERDLGASTLSNSNIGATDHVPFDEVGLPAFQWIRDYMEGSNTRAPHTNMDTYDHVIEEDLKQSVAVAAALIYQLAMRDEALPRKSLPY